MSGTTERERRERRGKQLEDEKNPENERTLTEDFRDGGLVEQMVETGVPPAIAEFYLPRKLNVARDDVLADCTNKEQWNKLLQAYKNDEIDEDDFIDVITTSHLNCDPEVNDPKKAHAETVKDVLTGRVGLALAEAIVEGCQTAGFLPQGPESKVKALLAAGIIDDPEIEEIVEEDESGSQVVKVEVSRKQRKKAREKLKEKIKENCKTILHDTVVRVNNFERLVAKLEDPEDFDFDIYRRAIVDISWDRRDKSISIYTIALTNLSTYLISSTDEDTSEDTYSSEREVVKYIIEEDLSQEQLKHLFLLIISKYKEYLLLRMEESLRMMQKAGKIVEPAEDEDFIIKEETKKLQWDKVEIQPYDNRKLDDLVKVFPNGFWFNDEDYKEFIVKAGIAGEDSQLAEYNGVLIGKTKYIPKFEVTPHVENTIADLRRLKDED